MRYWSAIDIINQVSGEVGLAKVVTLFAAEDVNAIQSTQLLSALNSAGAELGLYYPWAQLRKEWAFPLVVGQTTYALPADWSYFMDQTQWDRTNGGQLMGPKSPAEWAWIKGGSAASLPNVRWRVAGNRFEVFPVPGSAFNLSMEYVIENWVQHAPSTVPDASFVVADGDIVWYHPWLMVKYTKLKWLQLKNFPSGAAAADYQRMYDSLKGKDVGAEVLSLVPEPSPQFLGPYSIPDGSWNV